MSTSVTLTFGKEDILNTILTFPDGTIAFSTSTKESFWEGRDTTVIQGHNYFAKTHASIDWRDKYFDSNGQVLPFDRIKHTKTVSRWVELFFREYSGWSRVEGETRGIGSPAERDAEG